MRTGLTVIAYMTALTGQEAQVREALLELVAEPRKENSCINFNLHHSQENPAHFFIYENWNSAADLDAHARSAHLQAFRKTIGPFLERPADITKWIMVSDLAAPLANPSQSS